MATQISFKQLGDNITKAIDLAVFIDKNSITSWSSPIEIDGGLLIFKDESIPSEIQKPAVKLMHIKDNDELIGIAIVNSYNKDNNKFTITALKYGTGTSSGSGEAFLEEDILTNTQVGGINSNITLLEGTSFTDFVKQLLIKDMLPSFAFSLVGEGLHEVGTSVDNVELILNISSLGNVKIKDIKFYDGTILLATESYVDGQTTYSFSIEDSITTNKNYKVIISYQNSQYKDSIFSKTITFVGMSYYGVVNSLSITENEIKTLNKTLKNTKSYTYNAIVTIDNRICYAYPASFGELKSIKDDNNFDYLGSYTKTTQMINNETYYVYVLTDAVTVNNFKQIYN